MIDLKLTTKALEVMDAWADSPDMLTPDVVSALYVWGTAAKAVTEAEPVWKCISHDADVTDLSNLFNNETFNPEEEYCVFEGEFGGLNPAKCEIVRGVFVPIKVEG